MPGQHPDIADFTALRSDVAAELRSMRSELGSIRTDFAAQLRSMRSEAASNFRWVPGIMLGGFASLLGAMAHGFHWL